MGGILIINKLKTPLLDVLNACVDGTLHDLDIVYDDRKVHLLRDYSVETGR